MAERVPNWEQNLSDYLVSKRKEQFAYGSFDCAHFAAGSVEAITGQNPMESVEDYDSLRTSITALKNAGAENLEAFIDARFDEAPIGHAQTGDLAFHDGSVGVVINSKAVFASEIGYTFVDRSEWAKAWSVGRG